MAECPPYCTAQAAQLNPLGFKVVQGLSSCLQTFPGFVAQILVCKSSRIRAPLQPVAAQYAEQERFSKHRIWGHLPSFHFLVGPKHILQRCRLQGSSQCCEGDDSWSEVQLAKQTIKVPCCFVARFARIPARTDGCVDEGCLKRDAA